MHSDKYKVRFLFFISSLIICFIIMGISSCSTNSEEVESGTSDVSLERTEVSTDAFILTGDTTIHTMVEKMPEFPGGDHELLKFVQQNVSYPLIAQQNGVKGRVVCSFIVEKDGSTRNVEVVRGIDPSLDDEAVRVIKTFPKWSPGENEGEAVRVRYTMPISFRLEAPSQATQTNPESIEEDTGEYILTDDMTIFTSVDRMPQFPGGDNKLLKFIQQNVDYPLAAQQKGLEGRVVCSFVIEKDGSLSDIEVARGIDPVLDEEAVRVIKSLPNFHPGKNKGEIVRVRYTMPIAFRLQ